MPGPGKSGKVAAAEAAVPAQADFPDAAQVNRRLGRGVNVLGYDPLWRDRSRARFEADFFRMIREAGFTHVRINLHPFRDNPGREPGKLVLRPEYLETMDWAVDHALRADLAVILDFHEFQAMAKEPESLKPAFLAFWETVAQRYQDRPPQLLFELLNEPNTKVTAEMWNAFAAEALAIVRKTNPRRTVVIGPVQWNNISHLDRLALPEDDRCILVTIHYYSPFDFTHQGAAFAGKADKVGIPWGTEADRQAIRADFDRAQAWAEANGRPMYLGEFGVYDRAPQEDRVRWLSFVTREAERRGWSWGYWQFDGDFILFNIGERKWVEPVLKAIMPETEK
ncbi:MAG: glycoside hydrolase family 5 protein [Thermogutta sp.]|nr:glycoside hydrolase family 5 protein [Thermogutta sp.]